MFHYYKFPYIFFLPSYILASGGDEYYEKLPFCLFACHSFLYFSCIIIRTCLGIVLPLLSV